MDRKRFLYTLGGTAGIGLLSSNLFSQDSAKPPALIAEKVKEFVGVCHSDLDKVKALVTEIPNLVYASWDWGGGDFESGIEAAGHMGRKDIAKFLVEKGSRTNIFLMTMLGQTELIKKYLGLFPEHLTMRGPHGLSLLHHANKGGEDSKELVAFLGGLGLKETKFNLYS
ncbi:MAG: ankyrin repeat domain-containing protein [Saprospiraceae bacterium]